MPSVEDMIKKKKAKKQSPLKKENTKSSVAVCNNNPKIKKEEKKLADFDPFGVKFVSEYAQVDSGIKSNEDKLSNYKKNDISNNGAGQSKLVTDNANSGSVVIEEHQGAINSSAIEKTTVLSEQDLTEANTSKIHKDIRLSTKQEVIYNLLKKHRNPNTLITPVVKSSDLSKILEMSETSLRKQIQRMEQKGAIKRDRHISGPDGGTSYVVYDVEKETNSFLTELKE